MTFMLSYVFINSECDTISVITFNVLICYLLLFHSLLLLLLIIIILYIIYCTYLITIIILFLLFLFF